mmetsp:Transcript_14765/g.42020  ORF Transcript_14765/g.42020 Transcript_14765/m.42020 type:complete len:936 (+) Transcript_14765:121-2928(+)|eukprot:CAMPEP_0119132876 /NCGR_PEP_ID=MMETSP1310-20130426/12498_1 /TAXON_ID=464262 /ORGANISM="Genus nov. species nov., Strain RCC2339" /LENGTH=935 /DNA_ID=CAMNT_0007123543 /DNA_START=58 /DNA_END=2865 /DNA_ORIENTATION=-
MAAFFTSRDQRSISTKSLPVKKDSYIVQRKSVQKRLKYFEKMSNSRDLNLSALELQQFPELLLEDKRVEKFGTRLKTLSLNKNDIYLIPNNFEKYSFLRTFTISGNNLQMIPQSIGAFTNLTQLDLSYNRITVIDSALAKLTSLRELSLSWNLMESLPDGIFPSFSNLNSLDLAGNHLRLLPEDICAAVKLRSLNVSYNLLESIPDAIGKLTDLSALLLSFNHITALPDSIGNLQKLRELQIWENKITHLPQGFVHLAMLQSLQLSQNKLKQLEPVNLLELGKLTPFRSAENIDAEDNEIESLGTCPGAADFWCLFGHSDSLRLSYNKISRIEPVVFQSLQSLTSLDLASNRLSEVPESISLLKDLIILDLSYNNITNHASLEVALGTLRSLQCLNLGANALTAVPKAVKNMHELIWLNLFANEIEELPEDIFASLKQFFMPSMFAKSIRVSYNRIKTFPPVLCKMAYLQELHMAGNELKEIPDDVGYMKELIVMSFANNKYPLAIPQTLSTLQKLRKVYLRGSTVSYSLDTFTALPSLVEIDFSVEDEKLERARNFLPVQTSESMDNQRSKRFPHCCSKMASQKNEDRFCIRTPLVPEHGTIDYYAVFDGHAGSAVSQYCADNFHDLLVKELKDLDILNRFKLSYAIHRGKGNWKRQISDALVSWGGDSLDSVVQSAEDDDDEAAGSMKSGSSAAFGNHNNGNHAVGKMNPFKSKDNANKEIAHALVEAFKKCDVVMRASFEANNIALSQGSTGVVGLVWGNRLFVGNAGDARCVLGTADGQVIRMSVDHTPQERSEAERVAATRGTFVVDSLAGRTLRIFNANSGAQLAVSRALGDFEFGEVVTSAPYISFFDLTQLPPPSGGMHNILILACDGIWDVLKDEDAVNVVRQAGTDMQKASSMLRDYSYLRDSGDDLTVVAVCLDNFADKGGKPA